MEETKEDKQLNYETKCRRCGKYKDLFFGTIDQTKWVDFAMGISDMLANPRSYYCDKCKKPTVQDVVSYTQAF